MGDIIDLHGRCLGLRVSIHFVCSFPGSWILFNLELFANQGDIKSKIFSTLIKQTYKSFIKWQPWESVKSLIPRDVSIGI